MRPLRVELVGLWPEFYRICALRCDGLAAAGIDPARSQRAEYPPEAQGAAARLADVASRLQRDFGGRVLPVSVGYLSPRGAWLAWRHRLRSGGAYAVVAGWCLDLEQPGAYERLRQAVAAALART